MNIPSFALKSTLLLGASMFWMGSSVAAQLPSHPSNSAALFASLMQDPAPVEESESTEPLAPDLQRQVVSYATPATAGTIIIDTAHTYLYYVLGDGKAIRYGIGVGRDGFTWSGTQTVTRMAEWPDWTPPQEMIERQPYLPRWMAGGKGNPLGARAIYLGSTVYRIHGTNAPATIGTRVSSGCIRLTNEDVTDLYSRVTVGTRIIVLSNKSGHVAQIAAPAVPANLLASRIADRRANGIY
jgi:lipoprotein-anchoring transpeptidase ErfK/SrfK